MAVLQYLFYNIGSWVKFSTLDGSCVYAPFSISIKTKEPNLKLKTGHLQLLGCLLLAFTFPISALFTIGLYFKAV
jgi:hypothetical protein